MDTDDRLTRILKQNDELTQLGLQIAETVAEIWKVLRMGPKPDYTTGEIAELMRRSEFTVREWCRLKRIRARKSATMSGRTARWTVPFDEYVRLRRDGLLPRKDDENPPAASMAKLPKPKPAPRSGGIALPIPAS